MATSALVDVRDVVDWLVHTEERIGQLYRAAAKVCCHHTSFSSFLVQLAEDEKSHADFMSRAWESLCTAKERPALAIVLDHKTRSQVEELFERFQHLLTRAHVSRKDVVEYIARAESSELNPIFLYVADEYRKTSRIGEHMAGEIQGHLLRIQSFIKSLPKNERPSVDVCSLPSVGEPRFLVVDDHGPVRRLMASLLSRRGMVDTAEGGPEGLERIREHFHDGVVSDLQLPGMDGLAFYRSAVEYDGTLKTRFLFCSGDIDPETEQHFKKDNLPFLKKPFELHDFYGAIEKILSAHDVTMKDL